VTESKAGVLFDLDGTLVDTNYLHTIAWSRALRVAKEWAPMNAIHRLVGMGGEDLLIELLGHDSSDARAARAGCYAPLIEEAVPFPGAADLLQELHRAGAIVALATSAPSDELRQMLAILDCDDNLDVITSADDVGRAKPSPEVFLKAMDAAEIDPRWALAVGDSVWDIQAARSAGIGCVGVESGGFSRHELNEEGALAVYRDVDELRQQWRTSPLGRLTAAMPTR
jgi:HAD superfamily hydrolase (TIGR01509 family)